MQYDLFYNLQKISPALYLEDLRFAGINYISSPEIGFLKSIAAKVDKVRTKLVLRFLEPEAVEPTTKQAYGEILKNLAAIKPYASGILVPKTYIWPINKEMYLMPPTTLVNDAHKEGLEVYASGFANDSPGSFNYSYDPTAEYLQFIDNGQFSVDGVLTDFAPTASEAIGMSIFSLRYGVSLLYTELASLCMSLSPNHLYVLFFVACLAHNKNASRPQKGQNMYYNFDSCFFFKMHCISLTSSR